MRFGLDYAWTTMTPAEHKAIGSTFAARYLSDDPSKNLTRAEADQLRANGIDVVVVWESTAARARQGNAAGAQDARNALLQAQACGMPRDRPIYFAVDFDVAGHPNVVDGYFDGVAGVLGHEHCGAYAQYSVVEHLASRGFGYAWQTYAWSGGFVSAHASLYQYSNGHTVSGHDCDFNRGLKADFGQWGYVAPIPEPAGVARFTGEIDFATGHWHVKGIPAKFTPGGHDRVWEAKLGIRETNGEWQVEGLPFGT